MNKDSYSEMSDESLLQHAKKQKSYTIINAFLIGFLLGVAVYAAVTKGFGFGFIFPLLLIYWFTRQRNASKDIQAELEKRGVR